jgi:hypothetical protein
MENIEFKTLSSILLIPFLPVRFEEFVRTVLVNDIHIIIGHDHRFGRNVAALTTSLVLGKTMRVEDSSRYLYKKLASLSISSAKR